MLGDVVRRLVWAESKDDIRRDDPVPSCRLVSENNCDTGHSMSPAIAIYLPSSSIPFPANPRWVARVLPRLQVTTLHQCHEEHRLADRFVEDVFEEMVELFEIFLWHMSTVPPARSGTSAQCVGQLCQPSLIVLEIPPAVTHKEPSAALHGMCVLLQRGNAVRVDDSVALDVAGQPAVQTAGRPAIRCRRRQANRPRVPALESEIA